MYKAAIEYSLGQFSDRHNQRKDEPMNIDKLVIDGARKSQLFNDPDQISPEPAPQRRLKGRHHKVVKSLQLIRIAKGRNNQFLQTSDSLN